AFIRSLPDDCSIEEIRYHLYVYSRAEEGLDAFEAGLLGEPGGGGGGGGGGGVNPRPRRPRLTETVILAWADRHRARSGTWPTRDAGEVHDAPGETWSNLDYSLRHGTRGLPGGSSVARLLALHR